jgi:hypothetical protein
MLALRQYKSMFDIEVTWPGNGPSRIDQIIKHGHMIHHMCFETNDAGLDVVAIGSPQPPTISWLLVSFHNIDASGA